MPAPDDVYKEISCAILRFEVEVKRDDPASAALHPSDSCDRMS